MMINADVLVVGGGPAGVAAACTIAESGKSVLLCDQGVALGGAIHGKRGNGQADLPMPHEHKKRWQRLSQRLARQSALIEIRSRTIFIGVDATGTAVIKDSDSDRAQYVSTQALVLATGAYENIRPLAGWHLPGVVAAGGLQVQMGAAGTPPPGRVLLAGSGPLLLTVAAQLSALGRPPLAVIEAATPMSKPHHLTGVPLSYIREGASHLLTLRRRGVPWICNAEIENIQTDDKGLRVTVRNKAKTLNFKTDLVALHNGLQPNNIGLPPVNFDPSRGLLVVHAGDCQELLGARAAVASGEQMANALLNATSGSHIKPGNAALLSRHRNAQARLAAMFEPVAQTKLNDLPDRTVLCRCENRTVGDLRRIIDKGETSAREIKLNGRFGMGRCQGRFCGRWALAMLGEVSGAAYPCEALTGNRWPIRPISINSLANLGQQTDDSGRIAAEDQPTRNST